MLTSSLGPNSRALAEGGGPLPVQAQIEEMLGLLQAARRTWHNVANIRLVRKQTRACWKHCFGGREVEVWRELLVGCGAVVVRLRDCTRARVC